MKLFNTLTRSSEEFSPLNDSSVSLYTCGPTVYNKLTIGNWVSYLRWDILARTLKSKYDLKWYMNITDVGHLVSDADEGEDKLETSAKKEGKTAWDIADFYTNDFIHGLDKLNIGVPKENLVKATDHIEEQINLIKTLEEKSYTYLIDDGVYFDSTKFPDYGKMARLDLQGLRAGTRVNIGQKKHPTDFALWKFTPKDQKRDMQWESPWGRGFPGWHLECSAMAIKYLGNTIDIHTGGIDHIPVHHTNEIAQSEAATSEKFVRVWLHSNFLKVNDTKISKSLGNGYTLDDLESEGYSAMDFRMFVLHSHYQSEANFTWDGLDAARNRLNDLYKIVDLKFQPTGGLASQKNFLSEIKQNIQDALEDNLNTPQVLYELSRLIDQLAKDGASSENLDEFNALLVLIDTILGFDLSKRLDISQAQKSKLQARQVARQNKDWEKSDQLRDELKSDGIGIEDSTGSQRWFRINV